QLASVLQIGQAQGVDPHQRFNMMGMDSLTAIAFAARLETALGLSLPSTLAYNHPTLAAVVDALLERLGDGTPQDADPSPAAPAVPVSTDLDAWIPGGLGPTGGDAPRLLCFPHAGAGASAYAGWGDPDSPLHGVAAVSAVQPPGRGERSGEPLISDLSDLVKRLADVVGDRVGPRTAFFGHSLGALVSYGVARELGRRGQPAPGLLIVSGCGTPRAAEDPIHTLPDDAFLRELSRRYPSEGPLPEDPERYRAFLPILRADVALLETWRGDDGAPLDCPIRAFGGDDDPLVPRGDLLGWGLLTRSSFALRMFGGGHLFVRSHRRAVLDAVAADLRDCFSADSDASQYTAVAAEAVRRAV
ncbi:MAG: thioesterase domain-containing protein, partial [Acidobacteriota bacterium]